MRCSIPGYVLKNFVVFYEFLCIAQPSSSQFRRGTHSLLQLQSHTASRSDGQFMLLQTCLNLGMVNSCKSHVAQPVAGAVSVLLWDPLASDMRTCRADTPIVNENCCCPQAQTWCSVLTCHESLLCCHFLESHSTLWTIFPARMCWGSEHDCSLTWVVPMSLNFWILPDV